MTNIVERLTKILEDVNAIMDHTPIPAIAVTTMTKSKEEKSDVEEPEEEKKEAGNGDTREVK